MSNRVVMIDSSSAPPSYVPKDVSRKSVPGFSLDDVHTSNAYSIPIYGYATPIIVGMAIITNALVCIVLLKKNMRNPTNSILVAMAISDTLTGIFPLPCFIYFYSLEHYKDYVPYPWCDVYEKMTDTVPTMFHTASIWLTVALAVHRYVCVRHPTWAKKRCTSRNVLLLIAFIYVTAVLSQTTRFFENVYVPLNVTSKVNVNASMTTCVQTLGALILNDRDNHAYFSTYYWLRVIFIHLLPCAVLLAFNTLLVQIMREARRRRAQLSQQNRKYESRCLRDSSANTLMLIVVVALFLLVELPLLAIFLMKIVENTVNIVVMTSPDFSVAALFINFAILMTYPLNFFVYCAMSRQFRETFKRLVTFGEQPEPFVEERDATQYCYATAQQENGNYKEMVTLNRQSRHVNNTDK